MRDARPAPCQESDGRFGFILSADTLNRCFAGSTQTERDRNDEFNTLILSTRSNSHHVLLWA